MQLAMDLASQLARDPGNGLELLAAGGHQAIGRSEVLEQGALSHRPHAGQVVEQRPGHLLAPALTMEVEREAVRLVANPLQEAKRLGVGRDRYRVGAAGDEY